MKSKIVGSTFLFAVVALTMWSGWWSPAEAGSDYYLSPSGSDSASGSQASPWKTFEHALQQLNDGDTLHAGGGTYLERVESPKLDAASASAPIRVVAVAGERPVIKGVLWLNGADHWSFSGINVTWDPATGKSDEHMVKLTDGVGWSFSDAEIWGAESFAAVLIASSQSGEPRNWSVTNNCIHDTIPTNGTNNDHLIYANSGLGGSGGLIEGNLLFNATNGNGVKLGGSSSSSGGAVGVTVRFNTIVNTHQSILVSWQSSANVIEGNLLFGVTDNYANLRSFELSGAGNVASANAGGGSDAMFLNDTGGEILADGGDNVWPIDPQFSGTACGGYVPQNATALKYGYTNSGGVPAPVPGQGVFDDDDGSPHEPDIEKIAAANVTKGCDVRRFCPRDQVTRAQMASFLARALDLPEGNGDSFDDDNASPHRADIERIAAAGITVGCGNRAFCPNEPVPREQMATFLARALDLPDAAGDSFGDDDASPHEADIEKIRAAGITLGCGNAKFCPYDVVIREQMASFLARALDL